jgi:hypothetical protein
MRPVEFAGLGQFRSHEPGLSDGAFTAGEAASNFIWKHFLAVADMKKSIALR